MRDWVVWLLAALGVGLAVGGCGAAVSAVLMRDRDMPLADDWAPIATHWSGRASMLLAALLAGAGTVLLIVAVLLGRTRHPRAGVAAALLGLCGPLAAAPFVHWGPPRPAESESPLIPDRDQAARVFQDYLNNQGDAVTPAFRDRRNAPGKHDVYDFPRANISGVLRGGPDEVVIIAPVRVAGRETTLVTEFGIVKTHQTFPAPIPAGVRVRLVRSPDGRWLVDDATWWEPGGKP